MISRFGSVDQSLSLELILMECLILQSAISESCVEATKLDSHC
jgi:hypothetical protein